jgi:hypothetical protein
MTNMGGGSTQWNGRIRGRKSGREVVEKEGNVRYLEIIIGKTLRKYPL